MVNGCEYKDHLPEFSLPEAKIDINSAILNLYHIAVHKSMALLNMAAPVGAIPSVVTLPSFPNSLVFKFITAKFEVLAPCGPHMFNDEEVRRKIVVETVKDLPQVAKDFVRNVLLGSIGITQLTSPSDVCRSKRERDLYWRLCIQWAPLTGSKSIMYFDGAEIRPSIEMVENVSLVLNPPKGVREEMEKRLREGKAREREELEKQQRLLKRRRLDGPSERITFHPDVPQPGVFQSTVGNQFTAQPFACQFLSPSMDQAHKSHNTMLQNVPVQGGVNNPTLTRSNDGLQESIAIGASFEQGQPSACRGSIAASSNKEWKNQDQRAQEQLNIGQQFINPSLLRLPKAGQTLQQTGTKARMRSQMFPDKGTRQIGQDIFRTNRAEQEHNLQLGFRSISPHSRIAVSGQESQQKMGSQTQQEQMNSRGDSQDIGSPQSPTQSSQQQQQNMMSLWRGSFDHIEDVLRQEGLGMENTAQNNREQGGQLGSRPMIPGGGRYKGCILESSGQQDAHRQTVQQQITPVHLDRAALLTEKQGLQQYFKQRGQGATYRGMPNYFPDWQSSGQTCTLGHPSTPRQIQVAAGQSRQMTSQNSHKMHQQSIRWMGQSGTGDFSPQHQPIHLSSQCQQYNQHSAHQDVRQSDRHGEQQGFEQSVQQAEQQNEQQGQGGEQEAEQNED